MSKKAMIDSLAGEVDELQAINAQFLDSVDDLIYWLEDDATRFDRRDAVSELKKLRKAL